MKKLVLGGVSSDPQTFRFSDSLRGGLSDSMSLAMLWREACFMALAVAARVEEVPRPLHLSGTGLAFDHEQVLNRQLIQ